jgi:DNA-binding transcriptional LysR family regulator
LIEGYCRQLGIQPCFNIHQTIYSSTTLMRMVASGKLAILVPWLRRAAYPGVVSRTLIEPTPRLNFLAAYSKDLISPLARQFIEVAKEVVEEMELQKVDG